MLCRRHHGLAEAQKWLQTDNVLKWFGKRPGEQMKAYRQYVEDGLLREIKDPSAQMKIRSILGSDTFTDWVKREFLLKSQIRDRREQPELARQNGGIDVRRIVAAVAASYEIDPPSLLKKGCRKRQAKSLAIFLSSRHGRGIMSLTRMAAMFNLSLSGLTSVRDRMERRLAKSSATSELGKHYAKVIGAIFSNQVKLNTEV